MSRRRFATGFCACLALAQFVWGAGLWTESALGQSTHRHDFEGPDPSWTLLDSDVRYSVPVHQRALGAGRSGAAEHLRIEAGPGSYVYLSHALPRSPVIEELRLALSIRSNRSGPQLFARVVLPRASDPQRSGPMSCLVGGPAYTKIGQWQTLELSSIPTLLRHRARAIQLKLGRPVDVGEAYVDALVLNGYGGRGTTDLFIDNLEAVGAAQQVRVGGVRPAGKPTAQPWRGPEPPPNQILPTAYSATARRAPQVELAGSVLVADNAPIFPRAVEHQGEPLDFLHGLGFNAVVLSAPPDAATVADAQRLRMWLISPPPAEPPRDGLDVTHRVLAWDLGRGWKGRDLPTLKKWCDHVRLIDPRLKRPIVCSAKSDLRRISRYADLLIVDRPVLGTSLELRDYGTWVRQRPQLARAGTPIWATVQTELEPALVTQRKLLGAEASDAHSVDAQQLRLAAFTAVAAGSRGLIFKSSSRLDGRDAQARLRATTLELLNLELALVAPWAGAGNYLGTIASGREVSAAVFQTERSRLLLPMWSGPSAQLVAGQLVSGQATFIVPGVPDSYDVYEVTPTGVRPVEHQRVTGGVRVRLDRFGLLSLVVLTQDASVLRYATSRVSRHGRRAAELIRHLADHQLRGAEVTAARLASYSQAIPTTRQLLDSARRELALADQQLTNNQFESAYAHARAATRPISVLKRQTWRDASRSLASPLASPLLADFATLPDHWEFMEFIRSAANSGNWLAGGECESLAYMLEAGWQHVQSPQEGVEAYAELTPAAARGGEQGLRLLAKPADPANPPQMVESPPLFITTAPVRVEAGQLVLVHGFVQIPEPISGSVDGLRIEDSLSGEAMALRLGETTGWRPFTLYRVASQQGRFSVTFSLTGLGEAWIDDVSIEIVKRAPAAARRVGRRE